MKLESKLGISTGVLILAMLTSALVAHIRVQEANRLANSVADGRIPIICRAREVRAASDQELRLTMVVRVTIDEASAKVSAGPTEDFEEDLELPIWSGTIPARLHFGEPVPSTDGAMASGEVPLPASVQRLYDQQT